MENFYKKTKLVGVGGVEPPYPKDQIYSLAQLTIVAALPTLKQNTIWIKYEHSPQPFSLVSLQFLFSFFP